MSNPKPAGVRKYPAPIDQNPLEYRPSISRIFRVDRLGIIAEITAFKLMISKQNLKNFWLQFFKAVGRVPEIFK